MANTVQQHPRMHQLQQMARNDRRMFSSSDDNAMVKQIQATHSPDGRELDVFPVLLVIEDVLHRAIPDTGFINVLLFLMLISFVCFSTSK